MEILVRVFNTPVSEFVKPGQKGPGHRFAFSDDLVLERYDANTPGNGLPQNEQQRRAGTVSGFVTTLRIAEANDNFYLLDSYLFQFEATYKFNAVPNTPLQKGQVTAQGVLYLDSNFQPIEPNRAAITGGTEAYATARGQLTELNNKDRLLVIQL